MIIGFGLLVGVTFNPYWLRSCHWVTLLPERVTNWSADHQPTELTCMG